ncbi:acyl-CoA dehydrogenase [Roseomonas sp. NAR14]|uniref:Acyl-CoA dehydrogenase n=1 Tax=Roseomonas acroporae TaxID=2937791 RepID=A0A9X2BT31_9PROT|nr:acyl-CoA dehydrogenase [Roseomonas acroporae]MCK8783807.1 acyl-CoA dehydrogenase [Roseomonas acroporae]
MTEIPPRVLAAIAGAAAAHDREGSFPAGSLAALHGAGLLTLALPVALGGRGAGLREAAGAVAAVGGACAATGLSFAMQLLQTRLLARWPDGLARAVAADACRGGLVNALATEPGLGTPSRGGLPETAARREAGGWRLSGRKTAVTGAAALRWMLVFARAEAEAGGAPRTGWFLVPGGAPGVRVVESWDQLGLRGSASHDVEFDAVALPDGHAVALRPAAEWAVPDPEFAAWNAMLLGALYTGVAAAARDWLVRFLRERVPGSLGAPLATLPRMQSALGGIDALLLASRRLIDGLAREADAGGAVDPVEANLLKALLAENAVEAVARAARLAGNRALSRGEPFERHWRDVQCARIHAPQEDAAQLAAGRRALLPGA